MKKLVIATLVSVSALGAALPAMAAVSGAPDCGDQHACMYNNRNYGYKIGDKTAGIGRTNLTQTRIMSSWSNKTYATGAWFDNWAGQPASCYTMAPRVGNAWVGEPANDRAVSWQTTVGC